VVFCFELWDILYNKRFTSSVPQSSKWAALKEMRFVFLQLFWWQTTGRNFYLQKLWIKITGSLLCHVFVSFTEEDCPPTIELRIPKHYSKFCVSAPLLGRWEPVVAKSSSSSSLRPSVPSSNPSSAISFIRPFRPKEILNPTCSTFWPLPKLNRLGNFWVEAQIP